MDCTVVHQIIQVSMVDMASPAPFTMHATLPSSVQGHPGPTRVFMHHLMVYHQNGGQICCTSSVAPTLHDTSLSPQKRNIRSLIKHIHKFHDMCQSTIVLHMTQDQMRIQFDVVEVILLGLHFNGILLAHISLVMDLLLSVGRVVIEIHLQRGV